MSVFILPVFLLALVVICLFKRVKVYDCFLGGAKDSLSLVKSVFPYIAAIFVCIELFRASGAASKLAEILQKPMSYLGIPAEITELMLLVPMSGGGAIALLEDIIARYGVDSYIARCAACVSGASETIFYICAVYLSACKAKKLRYAVPVSLLCSLLGTIIACLLCRIM